ncbi:hypothetical protein DRQ25_11870, partial [Candidatus Fermentibacteria bacterium]
MSSKIKSIKFKPIQQKATSLTGGLNEAINNLELKSGELIGCTNYTELDGVYSGYRLVGGNERSDGSSLPSETDIKVYPDHGINTNTVLLLETDSYGEILVDQSAYQQVVGVADDVLQDTTRKRFGQFSYRTGNISATATGISVAPATELAPDRDFTL